MKDAYPDDLCPDCFMDIPKDAEDGDGCLNCGHVFYKANPASEAEALFGASA